MQGAFEVVQAAPEISAVDEFRGLGEVEQILQLCVLEDLLEDLG